MSKHLIIAEKPSVAADIARAVDFLAKRFDGVNRIHGLHMIYEENRVRPMKTLWSAPMKSAFPSLRSGALPSRRAAWLQ